MEGHGFAGKVAPRLGVANGVMTRSSAQAAPWARVIVLLVGLLAATTLAHILTGSVLPKDPHAVLLFQNGLLLLVLGSAILEHKFTRPADAVVNGLLGIVTLLPVYHDAPRAAWTVVFAFAVTVFASAAVCVALSDRPGLVGWRATITHITYRFSSTFGQARLFYSVLVLFGIFAFYSLRSPTTVAIVCFWALYMWAWSSGFPSILTNLFHRGLSHAVSATIVRVDTPNLVRANLVQGTEWRHDKPKACRQVDGTTGVLLPLYSEVQAENRVGTGLFIPYDWPPEMRLAPGEIVDPAPSQVPTPAVLSGLVGGDSVSAMIGFVVEDSEIGVIRFEIWDPDTCEEGQLVWVNAVGSKVYYQIVSGETREETFESNRHGYQVALAAQVGTLEGDSGFEKFLWLPTMNSPVFAVPDNYGVDFVSGEEGDFHLGTIPNSAIPVSLTADEAFDHHTAILGVTGCGKTELALDLIRHAVSKNSKVLAVDLTGHYAGRLGDLTPRDLSLTPALADELSAKLFAVETGEYKASAEKKALRAFSDRLKGDITASVTAFLEATTNDARIGLITLPEISNTMATLYITELYLTITLNYAKTHPETFPRTLVVLEEAHTVIPEASTMGLGDFDSKGLVGKITQIALQGRKYRVGLLVIAQRTATVSKSVLTQCNTIISFSCIDDTSIGFLTNVFGSQYAALLPALPWLQAVAYGRAIRSERPLIVEIPYSEAKATGGA